MTQTQRIEIMRLAGKSDALDLQGKASDLDGTAIIARESAVPAFVSDKDYSGWPVGAPVADDGQVWQLITPYDTAAHPGHPAELRALWSLCHTKEPARAKPWVDPLGTSGMYMTGECYRDKDGKVWRCQRDNIVHDAAALPSAWAEVKV